MNPVRKPLYSNTAWCARLGSALRQVWGVLLVCALLPAHAQITYVANRTAAANSNAVTITKPVGVATNDLLITTLGQRGQSATPFLRVTPAGAPAGWTRITGVSSGANLGIDAYWKLATATEPASYTWTLNRSDRTVGSIVVFRGVDTTIPAVVQGTQHNVTASTTYTAPSINTGAVANTMLLALYGIADGRRTINGATGMTQIFSASSNNAASGLALGASYAAQAAPGATGTRLSAGNTSLVNLGMLVALRTATPVASFSVNTGGATGNTCQPKNITITARDAGAGTLTGYGGTINLTTSTAHGNWAKVTAAGTLTGGAANNGTASYTFVPADNGVVKLALSNTSPDAALTVNVVDSLIPASSTTSTAIAFSDSAFVFTLDPVQVAARNQAISVALWAKDSATATTCSIVTSYSGAKNLKAWITRDVADPGGAAPAIGALSLPNAQPGANNLSTLTFASGSASFNLASTDVGKYVLNLRDDSSAFTTVPFGASSSITTRPFGLGFTNIMKGATSNPGGSATAGGSFIAAGDTFQATVSGFLWAAADDVNNDGVPDAGANITDNGVTPSYKWATTLSAVAPFTPAAGTLGALGGTTSIPQASFAAGTTTVIDLTYSEAGSVTLQASAANYLGTVGANLATSSGVVGRFFADHFALLAGASVSAGCGAFTYMDQALLGLSFTIEAQSKGNSRLNNYHTAANSFAVATVSVLAEDTAVGNDGTDLSVRVSGVVVPAPAWVSGRYTSTTAAARFLRVANPDGPYDALQLGVRVGGDPNGALLSGTNMNPATAGTCSGAGCNGVKLNAGLASVRYGRMRLVNGTSSQLLPATLIAEAQYYLKSAGGFTTNTSDACTLLTAANFSLGNGQGIATATLQINMAAGTLTSGRKTLTVSRAGSATQGPGGTTKGSVDVGLNLGSTTSGQYCSGSFALNTGAGLAHLRARWCAVPGTWDRDPVARAVFGVYPGSDTLLMLRENY